MITSVRAVTNAATRRASPSWTRAALALTAVGCCLALGWIAAPALAGSDDGASASDLSGSYICEQFRLDLTRAADGSYEGFRTPLDRAGGGVLQASAKVTERGQDRIVLSGDFVRFKETFP